MSKIEPIDDDQDYPDADIITPETANYKDDDDGDGGGRSGSDATATGGGGGDGDVGGSGSNTIPIETSQMNDTEKEAIDSKPNLGSLTNSSANIDDANKTTRATASVGEQQRRNSSGNGNNPCNTDANETNLIDSETNDRSDIDNKLG